MPWKDDAGIARQLQSPKAERPVRIADVGPYTAIIPPADHVELSAVPQKK